MRQALNDRQLSRRDEFASIFRRAEKMDIEDMSRALPTDALRESMLSRALIDAENDRSGATLALAALQSVMGTNDPLQFVLDDDGVLWPFVKGDLFWRGPLRRTEDGMVQMARFYPDEERIEWGSPFDRVSERVEGGSSLQEDASK